MSLANVRTSDFDFELPPELIAQIPVEDRDQSRLLVLERSTGRIQHRRFADLPEFLRPGDLLILNNSRVLRARLWATKDSGGAEVEILLLEESEANVWWALLRPGKRIRARTQLSLKDTTQSSAGVGVEVLRKSAEGQYLLKFSGTRDITEELDRLGEIPLPPYITRRSHTAPINDAERYQTVYADRLGSVAAPTAGLHFTDRLLSQIRAKGVAIRHVTLHVGLGTFAPVKAESLENHIMHEERFELSLETAEAIRKTRRAGGRIVAVGTTSVRVLEAVAASLAGNIAPAAGRTRIFIYPPYPFRMVEALVTNFHLPRSTLLMLVSAFAAPNETRGGELILSAYAEAIRERYRFFSYGDAMLIL